jgi:ech hydrogenase subunit A
VLVTIGFLILFPLVAAGALTVVTNDKARSAITIASAAAIMLGSVWLAINHLVGEAVFFELESQVIDYVMIAVDLLCGIYIVYKGIKHSKPLAIFLAAVQIVLVVVFEFGVAHHATIEQAIYVDSFSVLMALVIGIIGSGICVYSLGYMRDFQHHENEQHKPDRRPVFFGLMFVFLSFMYVVVFCNNLAWMFTGWEVTTVCSFALIGYTRTREAIDNSFKQITFNLIGGLAFAVALVLVGEQGILELDKLVAAGAQGQFTLPIMLLAIAGFTKAAQMPFQSWLLGAMVAPTPTSALLHSSTMVKAAVFLLIKLSPAFGFNTNGMIVVLVGGLTFLFCSALAVSQNNAKRVLAYSTVANLGLITACAGVGTSEAIWAAIFLLLFHAAAKSLLFLCVGTAEHHIGSRDIEEMDNLFVRMPQLARFMALGIATMFIAPFGMLVAKWGTIVSFAEADNIALLILLAFGSALTFMFWAKWLGKMLAVAGISKNLEAKVNRSEWFAIALMAVIVVVMCIGLPLMSTAVVEPYLASDPTISIGLRGVLSPAAISLDNLLIMTVIVAGLLIAFAIHFSRKDKSNASIYLAGVGLDNEKRTFIDSLSNEREATQRNWYLGDIVGEKVLAPVANVLCLLVIASGFILAYLSMGGLL